MNSDDTQPTAAAPGARSGLTTGVRASLYLLGLVVLVIVAFVAGITQFEATECSGPDFDGECDMAGFAGVFWALCAFVVGAVAIIVIEVVLAAKRRAGRTPTPVS